MRIFSILLFIYLSLSFPLMAGEPGEMKLFETARSHFTGKSYRKALVSYRELCREYPGGSLRNAALYQAGLCHRELEEYEEARSMLDELIARAPGTPWEARARWQRAELLYLEVSRYGKPGPRVEAEYQKADRIYSTFPADAGERCRMLMEWLGKYKHIKNKSLINGLKYPPWGVALRGAFCMKLVWCGDSRSKSRSICCYRL
jgi:tetratricopeptide (TPR) repeat protein